MRREATDIIRFLLWANLLAGFILYVTYYRNLEGTLAIIRDLAPPIIFVCGAILIYSHDHSVVRRRRFAGEDREVITLTYWDAMFNDVLAFLTAAALLILPRIFDSRGLDFIDLLQAGIACAAMLYLRNYYFEKIGK